MTGFGRLRTVGKIQSPMHRYPPIGTVKTQGPELGPLACGIGDWARLTIWQLCNSLLRAAAGMRGFPCIS